MTTAPNISIRRARGAPPSDPGADFRMCIIGTSSDSPLGTGALSSLYYQMDALVEDYAIGDGVDCGCHALAKTDDNPRPPGIAFLSTLGMSGLTAGVRGTLDISGVEGTSIVTKTVGKTPKGTYEPVLRVADDGNDGDGTAIGTAGIILEASPDAGRTWLPQKALGVATKFEMEIPNPGGTDFATGCSWDFQPTSSNKSALYTKTTALQTTLTGTGHFVLTTSSVHLTADTVNDTALAAIAAATTDATCIALFNACKQYLGAHGASTTYHTIADATLATALAAIPDAVTIGDVDLYLDNLVAAYNAHRVLTTGTVHGAADNTNTITAYTSAPGTLKTGDIVYESKTVPPQWAVADLYTAGSPGTGALMTIAQSPTLFGLVVITEPVLAADIATLSAGLDAMKEVNPVCRPTLIVRFRDQAAGESDATYLAALATFRAACASDERIHMVAGDGWLTDAFRSFVYSRSGLPALVARFQGMEKIAGPEGERVAQAPGLTARGPLVGFSIRDTSGNAVGHDERIRGGALGPFAGKGGFGCFYYESATGRQGTYYCVSAPTLYDVGSAVTELMDNRVSSGIESVLYGITFDTLGGAKVVNAGKIDQDVRDAMASAAMREIKEKYLNEIENAEDPNLVEVDEDVDVDGAMITTTWHVDNELFSYVNGVDVTIQNART